MVEFPTEHTITITIKVTEQKLHDNVVAAIEGGANYWSSIDVGKHQKDYANYFTATFKDIDDGKTYELSIPKLLAGLVILSEKYPWHFTNIISDTGDATTGDVLVQCALLGDIVYG